MTLPAKLGCDGAVGDGHYGTSSGDRQGIRDYLRALEFKGELLKLKDPVRLDYEVAACLAEADAGPTILFEDVGHKLAVVGNVSPSRAHMAESLGVKPEELQARILAALEQPLEHQLVQDAPCQEVVVNAPSLADELPIPRFFEGEDGSYITAGAIVARDRATGRANLSIARLRPLGGNRAFIGIAPNHHLARLAREAQARGERLDIAVCIGNHPAVLLAACLYLRLGDDELKVAGALLGEPLRVVRCLDSDLVVPASCECVLEGTIDAGEAAPEGCVSEFHGMYEAYGPGMTVTFSRLTRRRDALFQVILPGHHREHCLLGGVAIAAGLVRAVRASVPGISQIAVGMGGAGRLHAVVSLKQAQPGDAGKAMQAVWAAVNLIKRVVVVDDDIDPWDAEQVEWAMATRMKVERDLLVVRGARTDRSEPLAEAGTVGKLGMDATRRDQDRKDWRLAKPPEAAIQKARALLRAH